MCRNLALPQAMTENRYKRIEKITFRYYERLVQNYVIMVQAVAGGNRNICVLI